MVVPLRKDSPFEWLRVIAGGVTAPAGFVAVGTHTGVKRHRKDLSLLMSEVPAAAAGTFTTNKIKAAPLTVSRRHLDRGPVRAVIINSGNANACMGQRGLDDALRMAKITAQALQIETHEVLVGSTGVIGQPMPMDKIVPGIKDACTMLSALGGHDAAEGIMTTDTYAKEIAVEFSLGGKTVRMGGMAKGSGMIHPNMGTMMAFVTTDVAIDAGFLQKALRKSVDKTYNMISVDGDTSTNDMAVVMANGQSGVSIEGEGAAYDRFCQALDFVNTYLAKSIARDGEGATKLVEIHVDGARTKEDAREIARSIARSNLVKTAIYGEDANWGRIICAAGYSQGELDPDKVDIFIGDMQVAKDGMGLAFDEERATEILRETDVEITVSLNIGSESATVWTCDLTYDYVKINASYRS